MATISAKALPAPQHHMLRREAERIAAARIDGGAGRLFFFGDAQLLEPLRELMRLAKKYGEMRPIA